MIYYQKRFIIECWVLLFIPQSKNYICIDYLACQSKQLSEIPVASIGGSEHGDKSVDKIIDVGIPDLIINLMSCCGFLKNLDSFVVFKCLKRILEYYFSKGFNILKCNDNNLAKLPNDVKQKNPCRRNR